MAKTPTSRIINKWLWGLASVLILYLPLIAMFSMDSESLETKSGIVVPEADWSLNYISELSRYLSENSGFKTQAIRIDEFIDERLFREKGVAGSISPRVIEGKKRVAFIADAFNEACNPHIQTGLLIDQIRSLARAIEQSGRRFRLVVSPDKSTILSEFLPSEFPLRDCFKLYNEEFWNSFGVSDLSGFVDLRTELLAARTTRRELLYKKRDSHWDQAGAAVAAQAVVNSFGDGIWERENLQFTGLTEELGDLDTLLGRTTLDQVPTYAYKREDVVEDLLVDVTPPTLRHNSKNAYLIPGRTVVFGDSFSEAAAPFFLSYFEQVTTIRFFDFSPEGFMKAIANADNVIFWTIERSMPYRVAYNWGTDSFIQDLTEFLR